MELRELAEKMVCEGKGRSPEDLDTLMPEDIRLMFHELSAHQLELEMQNEKLRETQVKLDAARARYFDLYDLAPVGYCTLSEAGLIREPNLTLATLLDVDRSLLNNQPLSRYVFAEDQDIFYQCKEHIETGKPHSCELRMVQESGTVFWANITTAGARKGGSATECRVAINDISKRKQTEEALREREAQYHQIVDTAREGIWIMDANERTTFVNDHLAALLGHEPDAMKERPIESFMYPEDIADHVLRMKGRKQGQSDTYERRFRSKDGRVVWTIVSATPLMDKEGTYTGSFAMLTDITVRKRAEERMRQSEQHAKETKNLLKLVLDTIPIRLFWKDLNLAYMGCNLLFAQDAGYQVPEELIGLDDYAMGWKDQADAYRRDDMEVITSGRPKLHYEEIQTTPEGKQIWISTSKVPLRDDDGKIIGILGSYEDITQQKRAEEELIKSQKIESLGIISGGIAHDFNNVLMVMLGNISLAKLLLPATDQAYAYLQLAEEASQKAKDLALQFLTFSQGDTPVKKVLSAANLIRSYGRLALSGAQSICEYNIPDDLWNIEADDGQMGQVLTNLLMNADQSMEDGGTIRIDCENVVLREGSDVPLPNGNYLKIRVTDEGSGIPREHLSKIFDPYFTTKKTGRGLGLTATYSIIKKHGGHITVESTEGSGTTFTLYLPASLVPTPHPKKEEDEVTYGNGRILVMDDDELLLRVVGTMLEALGYQAEFAQDGEQCVSKYTEARQTGQPFDAVIMDLIVPGGMGGREAMQRLLEIDPHTKGIVTSGYSNNSILTDYESYGFSGVIAKPYRFSALSKQLQQILDRALKD
jgi:PAS domain S-box-containing protein